MIVKQTITSESDLKIAILELENKWDQEGKLVKKHFFRAVDSVRPINLIKSTFKQAVASTEMKDDLVSTTVGLTAGFLSKLLIQSVFKSPLNRLLGTTLMFGITKVVARNPETVKSLGRGLIKMIRGKPRIHNEPKQIG